MNITTKPKRSDFETINEYKTFWLKHKIATDPKYSLITKIYAATRNALLAKKLHSKVKYLECSPTEFRKHLESQFEPGWSWENYGSLWEVDHKVSLIQAFTNGGLEAMLEAANYKNTRPRSVKSNRVKKAKHTTQDRLVTNPCHIDERFDTHFHYKISKPYRGFDYIILDNILILKAEKYPIRLYKCAPTFMIEAETGPTTESIMKTLYPEQSIQGNRRVRIGGEVNDFRKVCFRWKTDGEVKENQRERERKAAATRYKKYPERAKAYLKVWQANNRDKINARSKQRRAEKQERETYTKEDVE